MAKKFDFVSPGVQINEIDQSQVPVETTEDGILLIGRTLKGPALKPVKVKDLDSFIEVFGLPQSGKPGNGVDIWRSGNRYGPTYAAYAAQAHLAAEISPVTFIRLLGENDPLSENSDTQAGWNLGGGGTHTTTPSSITMAYGLFIIPSGNVGNPELTGSLAAVIYTKGAALTLKGTAADSQATTSSVAQLIESQASGQPNTFKLDLWNSSTATPDESFTFHLDSTKKEGYIRNVLNTNPQRIETTSFSTTEKYFLGETFEQSVQQYVTAVSGTAGKQYGMLLPLVDSSDNHWLERRKEATAAKTGWIISRHADPTNAPSNWGADQSTKLFRVVALHEGESIMNDYAITISDLRLGTNTVPNSSFSLSVVDKVGNVVERFSNVNLDEASENFILKIIGDQDRSWDTTNKIFNITGDYPNKSNYIRIEMSPAWRAGLVDDYALPFGFYGPAKPKNFSLSYGSDGVQAFGDVINHTGTKSSRTITFSDGLANSDRITFTHPDLGDFVINFAAGSGAAPTEFTSGAATIKVSTTNSATLTAQAVAALINSIDGYNASETSTGVVTIVADNSGPHFNVQVAKGPDAFGRITIAAVVAGEDGDDYAYPFVKGNDYIYGTSGDSDLFAKMPVGFSGSFVFPSFRLTEQNSKMGGNYNSTDYFGVRHVFKNTSTSNKIVYQSDDYKDLQRTLPATYDVHSTANGTETSFFFTLDEIVEDSSSGLYYWKSGSLADGSSETGKYGTGNFLTGGVKQFNVPLFGGYDGLDITFVDPFSSEVVLSSAGISSKGHYAHYSIEKAIDIAADSESVRYDVVSIPGMTNSGLQNKLIRKVEERGDALVVIDPDDNFKDTFENSGTRTGGEVNTAISNMQDRDINSSYAAAYFPRLKLRDTLSGRNEVLVVPPSVGAIGAMAFSEANSAGPWFAPAGFNRGGLGILGGNSGPRIIGTLKTLSKKNRDELYQERINPIARFPAIGEIVIFGQKTLQQVPSALDRINVRRLMIFLKKKIGGIADTILFDQNVQATWNRFLAQADPLLASVQARFGVSDYKLVLDTSTTTEDLIDRNILYAKVFVKPAKAIEYIVIDFIVTRTGVEF
jgi:hypothetical protein